MPQGECKHDDLKEIVIPNPALLMDSRIFQCNECKEVLDKYDIRELGKSE